MFVGYSLEFCAATFISFLPLKVFFIYRPFKTKKQKNNTDPLQLTTSTVNVTTGPTDAGALSPLNMLITSIKQH